MVRPRAEDLGTELDRVLFQARKRPALDRLRRRQRRREIAEIVSERMSGGHTAIRRRDRAGRRSEKLHGLG